LVWYCNIDLSGDYNGRRLLRASFGLAQPVFIQYRDVSFGICNGIATRHRQELFRGICLARLPNCYAAEVEYGRRLDIRNRGQHMGRMAHPYYLYFLPESALTQVLPVDRIAFALIAVATMVCWTVMYVELYRITKSIWPVILLHAVEDATVNHLVIDQHIRILDGKNWLISPILGLIPSILYVVIGLVLRRERKKRASVFISAQK